MRVFGLHGLPGWVYALFSPAHRQFAVMDPFYRNQGIRQGRKPFGNAFYGNDLEAFVLFEQKTLAESTSPEKSSSTPTIWLSKSRFRGS